MRQFVISEEDLKFFIRTSKLYSFACECALYSPSEEELEVTEENLKRFTELKEYIKENRNEILHDNAEGMKDTNVPVFDLIKNNTVVRIKERKVEETELDDYKNIERDFKEIIAKLKQLDINIYNLIQFYDCDEIKGNDCGLVYYTRLHIKKCIKNIESLSFLKGI